MTASGSYVVELFLHIAPIDPGQRYLFDHLGGRIQLVRAEVIESRHAISPAGTGF